MEGKLCSKCKEFKIYGEFRTHKRHADGLTSACKECEKQSDKERYKRNSEKKKQWQREYREKNKDKVRESHKNWREKNKEYIKEKGKIYYENNQELIKKSRKRYYMLNKEKVNLKKKQWYEANQDKVSEQRLKRISNKYHVRFYGANRKSLLERDKWRCQKCKVEVHDRRGPGWNDEFKAHIDHIVPISRGGDSTPENLRVLCRTCNLSKSDKTDIVIKEDGQIALFI